MFNANQCPKLGRMLGFFTDDHAVQRWELSYLFIRDPPDKPRFAMLRDWRKVLGNCVSIFN